MKFPRRSLLSTVAAFTLVIGAMPAHADAAENSSPALDALESVADAGSASDVLDSLADVPTDAVGSASIDSQVNGLEITVPVDPTNAVTIGDAEVSLPLAADSSSAEVLDKGVVSFDAPSSTTVVAVKDDGSVQFTSVLDSADAPVEYTYPLSLPAGTSVSIDGTGTVWALDADGALVVGVAPAWAFDANGVAVPTHYEIDGSILTQVVDHTSGVYAYPIVADPYMGRNLIQSISTYVSIPKISLAISSWGAQIQQGYVPGYGGTTDGWYVGQSIWRNQGWAELTARSYLATTKATYHQQFDCHVLGAYTPRTGGPTWDLEGYRASRPNWLSDGGAWTYRCNWP